MGTGSFADYLSGLDEPALAALLRVRPDVRMEPVPRGFGQLAQRLTGPASLASALHTVDRDAVVISQTVAVLDAAATVAEVTRLLDAPVRTVRAVVARLCEQGLAWTDADTVVLPERLAEHWLAEIGAGRPVATIARSVPVNDLRAAAEAWGVDVTGLRKAELVTGLAEALGDLRAVTAAIAGLPESARERLELVRHPPEIYFGYGSPRARTDPDLVLAKAGLVLRVDHSWELPQEVAVAAWLAEQGLSLTGRPNLRRANVDRASTREAGQSAIQAILGAVTTLLDDAGVTPITALKKGGVGTRERSRLATRLSLSAEVLLLVIDLAYAAGLLGQTDAGYAPTDAYPDWRAASPGRQWAVLAATWFGLEHAPTSREIDGDKELPPPLPLASAAGLIRRAVLRAAADGRSVAAAGEHIDWFFPLHGYEDDEHLTKVAAAIREAELLGVVAADVVTDFGERLLAVHDGEPADLVSELAKRVDGLLPETPGTVILQSDLTAVVSGRPSVAVSKVLTAAAVSEARGVAQVWRFSPASVRAALDAGWTADALRGELAAVSDRPLPQPLDYLITDVARRHGQIRVRGMRSCVVADEATVTEILHTRSLARLHLARVAPTVLSSPYELHEVLARLRAAGLSPVAEDAQGTVLVEARHEHQAPAGTRAATIQRRTRIPAADLAARLLADPHGDSTPGPDTSGTWELLASQGNPHLSDAELELLTDAVDHHRDIRITYRDKNGSRTIREIQPREIYGRWLDSWCHLRNAQRDFTIANIESVAPVG